MGCGPLYVSTVTPVPHPSGDGYVGWLHPDARAASALGGKPPLLESVAIMRLACLCQVQQRVPGCGMQRTIQKRRTKMRWAWQEGGRCPATYSRQLKDLPPGYRLAFRMTTPGRATGRQSMASPMPRYRWTTRTRPSWRLATGWRGEPGAATSARVVTDMATHPRARRLSRRPTPAPAAC
jgi:hypothetical protein